MIKNISFHKSLKTLLLILAVFAGFSTVKYFSRTEAAEIADSTTPPGQFYPTKNQTKTTHALVEMLENYHYINKTYDDAFSEKIFDSYLKLLDPGRAYFLAADVKEFSKFRHSFDDDLKKGALEHAFFIYNRYHKRRLQRLDYTLELLDKGIDFLDFSKNEYLETDRENISWHVDMDSARDLWRRLLKNEILNLKLEDESLEKILTDVRKRYENQVQFLKETISDDVYEYFMTAYTHCYDPHTVYFPPAESENFEIHMRLSLEGIGALLRREGQYVKVEELVAGGPAERGKELEAGDLIVAVGQGESGDLVDVEGMRIDDVVDLIRGPKGTVVRLKVKPGDKTDLNRIKFVTITRDMVKLEEQSAKKKIIDVKRGERVHKVGVITVPAFYVDFEAAASGDPEYRSSTRDVERLIKELKEENIESLIIDLRGNGGGSLQEAKDMTGLFIETGPVVQIRSADNRVILYGDLDEKVAYSGNLVILVNRLSASASEILAGAIQDYGRGIIIGSQTFGKGTVQSMVPLEPGSLKYTEAKYYRINGDSTQNRGVIPDITFPSLVDKEEIGESSLPQTMAWDEILPVKYPRLAVLTPMVYYLDNLHKERVSGNADFIYLNERVKLLEENRKKTEISLNESERKQESEILKKRLLEMENRRRLALKEEPFKDYAEMEAFEKEDDPDRKPDSMLRETAEILTDWTDTKSHSGK